MNKLGIMENNLMCITGYAKLPSGITATEMYKVIAVCAILNSENGVIEDIDCSLVTATARNFIKELIVGNNINDLDVLQATLNQCYFGSAKKALMSALKIIQDKYQNINA